GVLGVVGEAEAPQHRPAIVEHVAEIAVDPAGKLAGDAGVGDQLLEQPAVVALEQDLVDQPHRIPFGRAAIGHVIARGIAGLGRQRVDTALELLGGLARLGNVRLLHRRGRGDRSEIFLHHRPGRGIVDVARDHEHRVVRAVEFPGEGLGVRHRRRLDLLQLAIEIMAVVPVDVGQHRQVDPRPGA
ncbi:hypothetical protein QU38_02480, partial [Staphylococcus aureus]